MSDEHGGRVGQHHAERGAGNDGGEGRIFGRKADGGDLRLSPISARKKAITVVPEDPNFAPLPAFASSSSILSGTSIHAAIAMKPRSSDPAHGIRPDQTHQPRPNGAGECVIDQRRDQNAEYAQSATACGTSRRG